MTSNIWNWLKNTFYNDKSTIDIDHKNNGYNKSHDKHTIHNDKKHNDKKHNLDTDLLEKSFKKTKISANVEDYMDIDDEINHQTHHHSHRSKTPKKYTQEMSRSPSDRPIKKSRRSLKSVVLTPVSNDYNKDEYINNKHDSYSNMRLPNSNKKHNIEKANTRSNSMKKRKLTPKPNKISIDENEKQRVERELFKKDKVSNFARYEQRQEENMPTLSTSSHIFRNKTKDEEINRAKIIADAEKRLEAERLRKKHEEEKKLHEEQKRKTADEWKVEIERMKKMETEKAKYEYTKMRDEEEWRKKMQEQVKRSQEYPFSGKQSNQSNESQKPASIPKPKSAKKTPINKFLSAHNDIEEDIKKRVDRRRRSIDSREMLEQRENEARELVGSRIRPHLIQSSSKMNAEQFLRKFVTSVRIDENIKSSLKRALAKLHPDRTRQLQSLAERVEAEELYKIVLRYYESM